MPIAWIFAICASTSARTVELTLPAPTEFCSSVSWSLNMRMRSPLQYPFGHPRRSNTAQTPRVPFRYLPTTEGEASPNGWRTMFLVCVTPLTVEVNVPDPPNTRMVALPTAVAGTWFASNGAVGYGGPGVGVTVPLKGSGGGNGPPARPTKAGVPPAPIR